MTTPPRPRRPLLGADFVELLGATEGDPATLHEPGHHSAATLVRAARDGEVELRTLLQLADIIGLEELALLWRDTDRGSLPSALWTLYLLRTWCGCSAPDVVRLWESGHLHAEVCAAVAGLPAHPTPTDLTGFADGLLEGLLIRDAPTALHRAAAFFRVIAAGRADLPDTGHAAPELGFCALSTAEGLDRAAAAAQTGALG